MKLKFDVSGSDPEKAKGTAFAVPTPGLYRAVLSEIDEAESKAGNPMLKVTMKITGPKFANALLFDYIVMTEASEWKLDQFLQAFGVASAKKRKGTLDTDDLFGTTVQVRVKNETYEGNPSAKIGAYLEYDGEDEDELDDDDELDADDESEPENEDEGEDEDEDEDDTGDDGDEPDDGYEGMDTVALRAELKSRDLNTRGAKPALVARLRENDNEPF